MGSKKIELNKGQQHALASLLNFVNNLSKRVFILNGYAGTGKTTLMKIFIEYIRKAGFRNEKSMDSCPTYHLLASTGRAAKILSNVTGEETGTVHSLIYKYIGFNEDIEQVVEMRKKTGVDKSGQLLLVFGYAGCDNRKSKKHIYIIDEASMVSDEMGKNPTQAIFGTG